MQLCMSHTATLSHKQALTKLIGDFLFMLPVNTDIFLIKDVREPASSYYAGYTGQDTDWFSITVAKYYNKSFYNKLTRKLL